MPTLDWIGKDAVIRHHKEVPFRLLEPDFALSHSDPAEGDLIVQSNRPQQGRNILMKAILNSFPKHNGSNVIYTAGTHLGSAALQREMIVFKQTPYAIEV